MTLEKPIHIVGGGLAGSEAAWQIAQAGHPVVIHEMRRLSPPGRMTDAHKTESLAELVCSNSFRSDDADYNAVGLLHAEMRRCDSLIMAAADAHRVPAGSALAVDRDGFATAVQDRLLAHPKKPTLISARTPITVQGAFSRPSVGVEAAPLGARAAGAVALGVLLTPLASILAFIDPGLAQDSDCAALMQQTPRQGKGG